MDLSNKVVLLTGAASGIGHATALDLAKGGATLVLTDINEDEGQALTQNIVREFGVSARFEPLDVRDASKVQSLVNDIVSKEGRLDCAVNNAGVDHPLAPFVNCEDEWFDKVIDVNLKGVFYCMKYELLAMLKQGVGSIVNIASLAGIKGSPTFAPYGATKHGVVGLTKSAALEYASKKIRINAVCPGFIDTPMYQRSAELSQDIQEKIVRSIPMKRVGQPEEIAHAISWLCSDDSSYMTGHTMALDGGISS